MKRVCRDAFLLSTLLRNLLGTIGEKSVQECFVTEHSTKKFVFGGQQNQWAVSFGYIFQLVF